MKTQRCANSWRHWGRYWSRHRVSQKAQQFLVEALQNNTVCQRKKVTEENKTAELPGSALPTHTLTYKCRYATYSRRFTESNPPHTHTHTQTHRDTHTLPLSCPSFSRSLTNRFSLRWSRSEFLMCHAWLLPQDNTEGKRFSDITSQIENICSSARTITQMNNIACYWSIGTYPQ